MFSHLDSIEIPFIFGDGIGPEISAATQRIVLKAVSIAYKKQRRLSFIETAAGHGSFLDTGDWLPEKTLSLIKEKKVALKGPLMTPIGKGQRSINVQLRKLLDLYACIRPVSHMPNVPSPLKNPVLDIVIFRENTEDVYRGIEFAAGSEESKQLIHFLHKNFGSDIPFADTSGIGIKPISKNGSARIARAAIQYALSNNRKKVTLIHKGNIMKFTEGLFRDVGYDVAETEFREHVFTYREHEMMTQTHGKESADTQLSSAQSSGKIIVNDIIADAGLMHLTMHPERFDVLVLPNLNGDYFSDAAAGIVGGLGVAPGANVNFETGHGLFEATHGTAPNLAGKNKANPTSLLLSACLLLEHIGWNEASSLIRRSLLSCFEKSHVTSDLSSNQKKSLSCSDFTQAVIDAL